MTDQRPTDLAHTDAKILETLETVHVDLGTRRYDIFIGDRVLETAGSRIKPYLNAPRVAVVTDETVMRLHGQTLRTALESENIDVEFIVRPSGEHQKGFGPLQEILNALLALSFDRRDTIIAFGGGVIGDLTGFAASIFKRGCQFIQIPTTLLSQVDSSVGGKTAINTAYGKNLIGAFYQPKAVLADISVLSTLPERELKAGYAEVLKYGLLGDAAFFDWLEQNGRRVLSGERDALVKAISVSCQTKARIVAEDEFETGRRALLNLGHTFGHALELEAGYDGDLLHGEAVSAGMLMAFEFSAELGLCPQKDVEALARHLNETKMMRPKDVPHLIRDPDLLLSHMGQDKKNEGGMLTLILVRAIGDAFVQKNASSETVLSYLTALTKKVTHA